MDRMEWNGIEGNGRERGQGTEKDERRKGKAPRAPVRKDQQAPPKTCSFGATLNGSALLSTAVGVPIRYCSLATKRCRRSVCKPLLSTGRKTSAACGVWTFVLPWRTVVPVDDRPCFAC